MENEYLSEFRVGNIDCFSLGDIDMTKQVIEHVNGTRPIVEAIVTHTISEPLVGVFAKLKENYREEDGYHLRMVETVEWEGEIETSNIPYAFDNIDFYHNTKVPYEMESVGNFLHLILVITDMSPFDKLPLDSRYTIHKAYGVKFLLGDLPQEPPISTIPGIETEQFMKIAGKWFRMVDKIN